MKTYLAIIIGAVIIGGCVYFGLKVGRTSDVLSTSETVLPQKVGVKPDIALTASCGAAENTIVTKVIDGDTVVVEGGWHVRLLGIDADEKGYPCYDAAKTRLENLVLSKQVALKKDVSDVDKYGRCLRYIFAGNANVDVQLAKEGLAIARFYKPDVKYKAEITQAEQYAQQNKIGCKWPSVSQLTK